MTFLEYSSGVSQNVRLQLFATDLNEVLLEKARAGLYPKSLVQDVSRERLRRFFVEEDGGYRISKTVREMCIFARQNIITDPPFSRMDLISCRNLLIYLEPELQGKVVPTFNYALKPDGFLVLGLSESTGMLSSRFAPLDKKLKIFSKKPGKAQRIPQVQLSEGLQPVGRDKVLTETLEVVSTELSAQREADRIALSRYGPPGVDCGCHRLEEQDRLLTNFGTEGQEIVGSPERQQLTLLDSKLYTPRSVNWNIQLDREWLPNLVVRVGYQQRQARREFVINPLENLNGASQLGLDNSGSSRYRELEVTANYKFREHDNIIASYVHSSAVGDLNDFNSYFGNFQNPIIRANERSRLPFDVPNRLLFRGEFQTRYRFTIAPVLDVRTGFPYSIIDEDRNFVGPRNEAGRFPTFVSLDMQILKTVSLRGPFSKYRAHLGLKVFNLTNHFNPRDVQNNLASDNFGVFTNSVSVKFGTRISFSKKE